MNNSYILPFVVALSVHAVIAVILFMQINKVTKVEVKRPVSIKASLVKLKPQLKTVPKKPKTVKKAAPKENKKPKPKVEPKKTKDTVKIDQPKKVIKPKPAKVTKPVVNNQKALTDDLLQAIAQEEAQQDEQIEAQKDEVLAMSFYTSVKQTVEDHWSRPPSARNGMEALLEIQLIPNGKVIQVNLIKSSGNSAFDRSAILAVKKAHQFHKLSELPIRVFDQYYRKFRLLFKPEDLRL